jgi:hypothetical protein
MKRVSVTVNEAVLCKALAAPKAPPCRLFTLNDTLNLRHGAHKRRWFRRLARSMTTSSNFSTGTRILDD